jgi:hypothetical protein
VRQANFLFHVISYSKKEVSLPHSVLYHVSNLILRRRAVQQPGGSPVGLNPLLRQSRSHAGSDNKRNFLFPPRAMCQRKWICHSQTTTVCGSPTALPLTLRPTTANVAEIAEPCREPPAKFQSPRQPIRPPLWSSGQSSWLHNGDVLCFL